MIVLMPLCAFGEEGGMCVFVSVDVRPCPGGSVIVSVRVRGVVRVRVRVRARARARLRVGVRVACATHRSTASQ